MKKFYKEQKNSIYKLQRELGVSHYCLYYYLSKPDKLKRMPFEMLSKIAELENLTPEVLMQKINEYMGEEL